MCDIMFPSIVNPGNVAELDYRGMIHLLYLQKYILKKMCTYARSLIWVITVEKAVKKLRSPKVTPLSNQLRELPTLLARIRLLSLILHGL